MLEPHTTLAWPCMQSDRRARPGGPQAVQAAQITFEDFFLSSMDISPLKIVGFEGLWGSLAMVVVLLPLVQHLPGVEGGGVHEDSIDTLHVRAPLRDPLDPPFPPHPHPPFPLLPPSPTLLVGAPVDVLCPCNGASAGIRFWLSQRLLPPMLQCEHSNAVRFEELLLSCSTAAVSPYSPADGGCKHLRGSVRLGGGLTAALIRHPGQPQHRI